MRYSAYGLGYDVSSALSGGTAPMPAMVERDRGHIVNISSIAGVYKRTSPR